MVEYGIVEFFDNRDGKKFGFIRVLDGMSNETGEEIFFHRNDFMFANNDGARVCFCDYSEVSGTRDNPLRIPAKGDKVVFERKPGKGGKPKAHPWTYTLDWLNEEAALVHDRLESRYDEEIEDEIADAELEEEGNDPTSQEVRQRIHQWAGGNTDLAREAAELYPGDFI